MGFADGFVRAARIDGGCPHRTCYGAGREVVGAGEPCWRAARQRRLGSDQLARPQARRCRNERSHGQAEIGLGRRACC